MNRRGSTAVWGLILMLGAASAALAWIQLSELPELEMVVGPDLTVRHATVERDAAREGQTFQRGDRLTHIEGISVDDLREFRALLPPLITEADPPEYDEGEGPQPGGGEELVEDGVVLDYQLLRPVHRFLLALQEETVEPGELPPGVESGDRLVEVDGRLLPDKLSAEGIRSVAASRPDAVLGIERSDAVFSGQLKIGDQSHYPEIILTFAIVLAVIGIIWRWHSERVGTKAAYCIGLETLCLGWICTLIFGFQWVLADYLLAAGVVVGLVMTRPLSMYARQQVGTDGGSGGSIAVGLGAVTAAGFIGLMFAGYLPSAEETIHGAAIVAGLFIIYELAVGSMEGRSLLDLGQRGGYLAGIVVLGLFVCLVALVMQPVAFGEDLWRWFAVSLPAVLWFGDVLYAVKYGAYSAMGEIADRPARQKLIAEYLREMTLELPHTDLRLVGVVGNQSVQLRRGPDEVVVEPVEESISDAVEIMITENATIPLPEGADRRSHPMDGIAKAMNISLGLVLGSPAGSLELDDDQIDIVLVGMRESSDGDVPSYASSETLDRAQQIWNGPVASAATIEMIACVPKLPGTDGSVEKVSGSVQKRLEQAEQDAAQYRQENEELAEQQQQIEHQLEVHRRQVRLRELTRPASPPGNEPEQGVQLLEGELVEGLEFLLDDPEPIVLAGPAGAGKEFTALSAHLLDGGRIQDFLVVDTSVEDASDRLDEILGEEGGGCGAGLLDDFQGALTIRGAQQCDDRRLLVLCHQCEEKGVRLYLNFDADDAEQRSALEERPQSLQELLMHREVIIPRFRHRNTIMVPVFEFWLQRWAGRYDKRVEGFSRMAVEALESYEYPGQISEAVEVVRLAVVEAQHDVVDRENLPRRVRDARPL